MTPSTKPAPEHFLSTLQQDELDRILSNLEAETEAQLHNIRLFNGAFGATPITVEIERVLSQALTSFHELLTK